MRKEVANNDDVSDVDDVDLECRWRSAYHSADVVIVKLLKK
jgi:hypothetical protein